MKNLLTHKLNGSTDSVGLPTIAEPASQSKVYQLNMSWEEESKCESTSCFRTFQVLHRFHAVSHTMLRQEHHKPAYNMDS